MRIRLADLKKREYSESFDDLLKKAKGTATESGEELEILRDWILHDLSCRKSSREEQSSKSTFDRTEKTDENRPRIIVKNKMKAAISTKPCSDIMISNGENGEAYHCPSGRNVQQMKQKQSPYASCSKSSEDQDGKEASSSSYASAWRKRKCQLTEDQDGYYYTYAGEAGNMMNSTKKKKKKVNTPRNQVLTMEVFNRVPCSDIREHLMICENEEACHRSSARNDQQMNRKQIQKKAKMPRGLPIDGPAPELPKEFRKKIESLHGSEAKLVIHKKIYSTDVSKHHDRLNMPRNQVVTMDFLNEQERQEIEVLKHGLEVRVIEPCLEETTLYLRKWPSHSGGYSYVLNSGWKHVVGVVGKHKNNIIPGNTIQVWSFRVHDPGELWFALVCPGAKRSIS